MKEIVERLLENHRMNEMTKRDAIARLTSVLTKEYPDCDVTFNSYHNCLEVTKDGVVQWQVYPSRVEKDNISYRYKKIEDISQVPEGTPLYTRESVPSHRYSYSNKSATRKHVDFIQED